jgi:hypothetical protein
MDNLLAEMTLPYRLVQAASVSLPFHAVILSQDIEKRQPSLELISITHELDMKRHDSSVGLGGKRPHMMLCSWNQRELSGDLKYAPCLPRFNFHKHPVTTFRESSSVL